MADNVYAIQRAQEIFKTALGSNELNKWQSALRKIARLTGDKALVMLLEDPKVSLDDKAKELSERLGETDPQLIKLLSELIVKGRLAAVDDIYEEYQRLVDNHRGIEGTEIAEVTTAIPLDDKDSLNIAKRLTTIIGKPVVLKLKVDPDLIGGIVIKIGDKLIDGSIRSKLDTLKREIGKAVK